MEKKYEGNTMLKKLVKDGVPLKVVEQRIKDYERTVAGLDLCGVDVESVHFEDFFRDLYAVVESKGVDYDAIAYAKEIAKAEYQRRKNARNVLKQVREKLK